MNRIKQLRLSRNWQQADLAEAMHVSQNSVSRYERETRSLNPEIILQLCDIFGCTSDYILCRSDSPTPTISEDEAALLRAYRAADDHTKAVVRLALEPFSEGSRRTQVS